MNFLRVFLSSCSETNSRSTLKQSTTVALFRLHAQSLFARSAWENVQNLSENLDFQELQTPETDHGVSGGGDLWRGLHSVYTSGYHSVDRLR